MDENRKKNRLWRVPLAAAGLTTLIYVWVHGLNNVPVNNIILSCFSGKDGSFLNLPDQIILPFYISDLWNILLVAVVVFFLVWFFQESKRSETARKALGKLYDLGFLVLITIMIVHFLVGGISDVNYWGPIHGSNIIFIFSFIIGFISFYLRKKMGIWLSLTSLIFIASLIMTPLSLISGIPTGLFAAMVSLSASFSACFLYSLLLWITGEKIFTSLDWLRSEESLKDRKENEPIEQRVRYYLAKNGKYQQLIEGKGFDFSIVWGLRDCLFGTKKIYSIKDAADFITEFQREKISRGQVYLDGKLIECKFVYSYKEKSPFSNTEPQVIFFGTRDPIYNPEISDMDIEEFVCSLAAYVAEKLGQERVLITYGNKTKVIKRTE